jgi:hypothetical protein
LLATRRGGKPVDPAWGALSQAASLVPRVRRGYSRGARTDANQQKRTSPFAINALNDILQQIGTARNSAVSRKRCFACDSSTVAQPRASHLLSQGRVPVTGIVPKDHLEERFRRFAEQRAHRCADEREEAFDEGEPVCDREALPPRPVWTGAVTASRIGEGLWSNAEVVGDASKKPHQLS